VPSGCPPVFLPVVAASKLSSSRSPVDTSTVPAVQALVPGNSKSELLLLLLFAVEEEDDSAAGGARVRRKVDAMLLF